MEAKCPGCGNPMQIGDELRGTTVECPWCRKRLRVPAAAPAPQRSAVRAPVRASARQTGVRREPAAEPQRTCPSCGAWRPPGRSRCPECGDSYRTARDQVEARRRHGDAFALERSAFNAGVVGGIFLIVVAGVWFYLGYQAGWIFFYPPILAVIGLAAIVNGLLRSGRPRTYRRRR